MRKLICGLMLLNAAAFAFAEEENKSESNVKKEWSLNSFFATPDDVWKMTTEELMQEKRFRWTSQKKEDLRYYENESNYKISLWSCDVEECIVTVKENKPVNIVILFFSRGDSGKINHDTFFDVIENVKKELETRWGKPQPLEVKKLDGTKKMNILRWKKEEDNIQLVWSYNGKFAAGKERSFVGEYVKLTISQDSDEAPDKAPVTISGKKDYSSNVVKNDNGSVFIDNIPMVDQGHKGYCVVATAERVLKYYGQDVDQHILAQVSETSQRGTQLKKMQESMDKLEKKFRFKHRSLYLQKPMTGNVLKKIYDAYDDIARKKGKNRISQKEFAAIMMDAEDSSVIGDKLDYEVFMEVKKKIKKSEYKRFISDVETYVNQGIPCVWSVFLGLVKEKGLPQVSGGHQRLIIGYDEKEKILYYSDSWGSGHEKKSMTMDEAWTITMALDVYIPLAEKR